MNVSHHNLQGTIIDAAASLRAIRHHCQLVHVILKRVVMNLQPKLTFML